MHNLISFFGADHKVGTTMLAQSVAELISENQPNLKILLAAMNSRESNEYNRENPGSIDEIKFRIDNKMISGEDFIKTCSHRANLYMLSGIVNEMEARYYFPETAAYFLEEIAPMFDLVITDCGSELDNGLALGTLLSAEDIFLVAAQQESVLRRFEKNKGIFEDLSILPSSFLINKYDEHDPFGLVYLAGRAESERDRIFKIDYSQFWREAERQKKSLLEFKGETYQSDIMVLANYILTKRGMQEMKTQRKRKWRSFI